MAARSFSSGTSCSATVRRAGGRGALARKLVALLTLVTVSVLGLGTTRAAADPAPSTWAFATPNITVGHTPDLYMGYLRLHLQYDPGWHYYPGATPPPPDPWVTPGFELTPFEDTTPYSGTGDQAQASDDCNQIGITACTVYVQFFHDTLYPTYDPDTYTGLVTEWNDAGDQRSAEFSVTFSSAVTPPSRLGANWNPDPNPSVDFTDIPAGTSATRDIPVHLDAGYSYSSGTAGNSETETPIDGFPIAWEDGSCVVGATGDCTAHIVYSPTTPRPREEFAYDVDECRGVVCYGPAASSHPFFGYANAVAGDSSIVVSGASSVRFGSPSTLTATVSTPAAVSKAGTVTFTDDGNPLGTASATAGGTATLTTSALHPGTNHIVATYSGNADLSGSTSSPFTVSTTFDRCITTVAVGGQVVHAGQALCITGTVVGAITVQPGGALAITGAHMPAASVTATGATAISICGVTAVGALTIRTATGPVVIGGPGCSGNHVTGHLTLAGNTGGVTVAGNTIYGFLSCAGNVPPPSDAGHPNTVHGARLGQCSAPSF